MMKVTTRLFIKAYTNEFRQHPFLYMYSTMIVGVLIHIYVPSLDDYDASIFYPMLFSLPFIAGFIKVIYRRKHPASREAFEPPSLETRRP
jgi:hypothetical protein